MNTTSLPVLLYHYISKYEDAISVHPDTFEAHCKGLAQAGYRGVGLDEAVEYALRGKPLPKKSVLFSFDDGFLDNYVYAAPLLKQYGHKGVVFAVTGKIESTQGERRTLEHVRQGIIPENELPNVDVPFHENELGYSVRRDPFMNWDEARALEKSGVMRLAAHSSTHESVFKGPEFSEKEERTFFAPGPRKRTFDRVLLPGREKLPWGLPCFEVGPALSTRAFLLSDEILEIAFKHVPQNSEEANEYLRDASAQAELWKQYDAITPEGWGRLESEEEYRSRVREDLRTCRDTLLRELGDEHAPARAALAWPWGAYTEDALRVAQELDFGVFYATTFGANPPARKNKHYANHVHRFKARDKSAAWMLSRVMLYSNPLLARLYAAIRI